jgi:hypothetical protein
MNACESWTGCRPTPKSFYLPELVAAELLLSPIEDEPQNQKDKNDDQDDPQDAADRKKNCHRHSRPFP